jgi:hypothetical protein
LDFAATRSDRINQNIFLDIFGSAQTLTHHCVFVTERLRRAIGTFWLTFAGCGSAVIASAFPQVGIGLLGVSLAFGLTVLSMAYAIGHVSGCHLNPAVTVGLAAGGRFPARDIGPYVIAQVVGLACGLPKNWESPVQRQSPTPTPSLWRRSMPSATRGDAVDAAAVMLARKIVSP